MKIVYESPQLVCVSSLKALVNNFKFLRFLAETNRLNESINQSQSPLGKRLVVSANLGRAWERATWVGNEEGTGDTKGGWLFFFT